MTDLKWLEFGLFTAIVIIVHYLKLIAVRLSEATTAIKDVKTVLESSVWSYGHNGNGSGPTLRLIHEELITVSFNLNELKDRIDKGPYQPREPE